MGNIQITASQGAAAGEDPLLAGPHLSTRVCHMKVFVFLPLPLAPGQAGAVLTGKQKSLSDQSKTRPWLAQEGCWTLFTPTH